MRTPSERLYEPYADIVLDLTRRPSRVQFGSERLRRARRGGGQFGSGLVVTAADIASSLAQDDATAKTIDTGITYALHLDPALVAQWKTFYAGYQAFSNRNKNLGYFTLGLPNIGDQVVSYETQLANWNTLLQKSGAVMAPTVQGAHGSTGDPSWLDKNKGVVVGVLVVAGLLAASVYVVPFIPVAVRLLGGNKKTPDAAPPRRLLPSFQGVRSSVAGHIHRAADAVGSTEPGPAIGSTSLAQR